MGFLLILLYICGKIPIYFYKGGDAMIFLLLALVLLMFIGMKFAGKGKFFYDYCSHKNTGTVNAVFSVLIFLSHSVQYLTVGGGFDAPYLSFRKFMGQLVVVTFLFFSGYGITESIKRKGDEYVKKMPKDRLLKTWLHFAIVIVIFAVVQTFFCGKKYDISRVLLSFIGYKSIGNSNWYMFVTFAMYIIVIISFKIFKGKVIHGVVCTFALSVLFVLLEIKLKLPVTFYGTLPCFLLGMVFALTKPYTDKLFMKNDYVWLAFFILSVVLFVIFSQNRNRNQVCYILFTFTAMLIVLLFMMKINISNPVFNWLSKHIFSFFILQRVPMIILQHIGFNNYKIPFIIVSLLCTVFLSLVFDELMKRMDKKLFKK